VTILLLCVDFVFDAVGIRYAVKIVARFCTVRYEHMKRDVVACAFVFVPNFLESDNDITTIKRVKFFLRHSVVSAVIKFGLKVACRSMTSIVLIFKIFFK